MQRKVKKVFKRKPLGVAASQMLTLEPRILLDAAAIAVGADMVVDTSPTVADSTGLQLPDSLDAKPDVRDAAKHQTDEATDDENDLSQYGPAAIQSDDKNGVELVIVDKSIANYQSLIADIVDENGDAPSSDRMIEIITIEADSDGILQITNALQNYENVSAVHILSHADQGELHLGNSVLNSENLSSYDSLFSSWDSSLNEGADLLLYGCNVAEGEAGIQFVNELGDVIGVDVAASTDTTGHADLGGDWDLEYESGIIEVTNPLGYSIMDTWKGVLDDNLIGDFNFIKLVDADEAIPGDTVNYKIFFQNLGEEPLTNVVVEDLISDYLTNISVSENLININDVYETVGNTTLQVTNGIFGSDPAVKEIGSLLTNDNSAFGGFSALISADSVSELGGVVSVNADGTFTYTPPVGVTGVTDSFTYVAQDEAGSFTYLGNVEIAINDMVWYVDDDGTASGDGTSGNPFSDFTSLSGTGGFDAPGSIIHVSDGVYSEGIVLDSSQILHGQGSDLMVGAFNLQSGSLAQAPVINSTGDAIITNVDNILEGFTVGDTVEHGIVGTAGGSLTINDVTIEGEGGILDITGKLLNAEFISLSSSTSSLIDPVVNINSLVSGSTLTVLGSTVIHDARQEGIMLTNNGGSSFSFETVDVITNFNTALKATGGGTLNTNGDVNLTTLNHVNSDYGVVLDNVNGTTNNLSGFTFTTVNYTGNRGGLILTNLTDSFTLTGNGTDNSGGVINVSGNEAIYINNVTDVSLDEITVTGSGLTYGVNARYLDNLTVTNSDFSDSTYGILARTFANHVTIDNNEFSNMGVFATWIYQDTFGDAYLTLTNNISTVADTSHVVWARDASMTTLYFDIGGNVSSDNRSHALGIVAWNQEAHFEGVIYDNNFSSERDTVILVPGAGASGDYSYTVAIQNNTLTQLNSSVFEPVLDVEINNGADNNLRITENTFNSNSSNFAAILSGFNAGSNNKFQVENNTFNSNSSLSVVMTGTSADLRFEGNTGGSFVAPFGGVTLEPTTNPDEPSFPAGFVFDPPMTALNGENNSGIIADSIELQDVQSLLDAAISYWGNTTVSDSVLSQLDGLSLQITDLPDGILGSHDDTIIYLDHNAANYGWYVDGSPQDSVEFSNPIEQMDLLTVIMHEMGHALGFSDIVYSPVNISIMSDALDVGVRYLPSQDTIISTLSQNSLDAIMNAAIQRWIDAGISDAQVLLLNDVTYSVGELETLRLAEQSGTHITFDDNAAGQGWFIDSTPMDNAEYALIQGKNHVVASSSSDAYGQYDLLTAAMHELGHVIGLSDVLAGSDVMNGVLELGERSTPSEASVSDSGIISKNYSTLQQQIGSQAIIQPGEILVIDIAATVGGNFPVGLTDITNVASLTATQLSDPLLSNMVSTSVLVQVFNGNPENMFQEFEEYFEAGRDEPLPVCEYNGHGRLISLDTMDANANLHGGRHFDRYDPVFGSHSFMDDKIETVKFAEWPSIHSLLLTEAAQNYKGINPAGYDAEEHVILKNQVDNLTDDLGDQQTENLKTSMHEKDSGKYATFSSQVRTASNDFEHRKSAFSDAARVIAK